jgi:hypothetical protein
MLAFMDATMIIAFCFVYWFQYWLYVYYVVFGEDEDNRD